MRTAGDGLRLSGDPGRSSGDLPSSPGALSCSVVLSQDVVEAIAERAAQIVLERESRTTGWPEWMGVETAARYLDISPERVRKLQARRLIPYHQEGPGCRVFFRRAELDAAMSEQVQRARRS